MLGRFVCLTVSIVTTSRMVSVEKTLFTHKKQSCSYTVPSHNKRNFSMLRDPVMNKE